MKTFRLVLSLSFVLAALLVSHGQEPLQNRHHIENGESYETVTRPYVARVPYVLKWSASKTYNLWGKDDASVKAKAEDVDVFIYNAEGKVILRVLNAPHFGEVKVPVAGTHQVRISTLGKWETWYVEDEKALREWAVVKNGIARPELVPRPAMVGGVEVQGMGAPLEPMARIRWVACNMIDKLNAERAKLDANSPHWKADNTEIDIKIRAIETAASQSISLPEFHKRTDHLFPPPPSPPKETAESSSTPGNDPSSQNQEPLILE